VKEALRFAFLTPELLVASGDIDNYKKRHYILRTVMYLGRYMITDAIWKSAVITLAMGITNELVYDELLGK